MPQKKYIVRLTAEEREVCQQTIRKLSGSSEKVRRAQVLLKADADGPAWTDQQIADAFSCRTKTVENIRQRCVLEGFEQALERKRRESPPVPKLLDGEQEAQIIALRLGSPPKGYANWSLRLLARRVVELAIVESISHETIRRMLKKRNDVAEDRVLGDPAAGPDAEFVAHMEQVLDIYAQPHDPACPVVCMDEQPVQLVKETRPPIAATKERAPVASITNTNGRARPRSSCSASRWPVGGRRRRGHGVRRRIGPRSSPACWKDATPSARRSSWCATT